MAVVAADSGGVSGAATSVQGPPSDEVTDLKQRLAILQQKRADDKVRIKELEKYKAQLMQVINKLRMIHTSYENVFMFDDLYHVHPYQKNIVHFPIADVGVQAEMV